MLKSRPLCLVLMLLKQQLVLNHPLYLHELWLKSGIEAPQIYYIIGTRFFFLYSRYSVKEEAHIRISTK